MRARNFTEPANRLTQQLPHGVVHIHYRLNIDKPFLRRKRLKLDKLLRLDGYRLLADDVLARREHEL